MSALTVVLRAGEERQIEVPPGINVMEAIRNAGIDEIVALCGGSCSCATCHVYVDPAWYEKTGAPGAMEQEMISLFTHAQPTSRLACQVVFGPELDGLNVAIAPEE